MRIVGDLYAVLLLLAVVAGLRAAEDLHGLASRLGASESTIVDGLAGWLPIGGTLLLLGVIGFRTRWRPLRSPEKVAYAALAVPLVMLATAFFYTPFIEDRSAHLAALDAGGATFRATLAATQWAVPVVLAGILGLGLAQLASPRWQSGNAENELRSHVAGSLVFAVPSLAALLVGWAAG